MATLPSPYFGRDCHAGLSAELRPNLITAAVLFQFGTGPVKGFAVSLSLGIVINLFTSLGATKAAFDTYLRRFPVKRLSI